MEMDNWIAVILGISLLIVGVFSGGALFSTNTEVEVEKIVEAECPECEVCETCEETIVEVPTPSLLDLAVEDFMKAVDDEEVINKTSGDEINLLKVDGAGHEYDFDEISVSRVYEDYTIDYDGDETIVTFDIKLKYKEDGEESEKVKYKVEVVFEEDEDTKVTILEE